MKFVTINIDFTEIDSLDSLHESLFHSFGFPDFYGRNFHAFVDCVSSIRYPEEGMTSFFLEKDEFLLIQTKKLAATDAEIANHFIRAIECLNEREFIKNGATLVFLSLI